jgi:hypothetical protein
MIILPWMAWDWPVFVAAAPVIGLPGSRETSTDQSRRSPGHIPGNRGPPRAAQPWGAPHAAPGQSPACQPRRRRPLIGPEQPPRRA